MAPADVAARMAAFLADKDGKQAHDFPAWNDYREIVGDTPDSHRLFVEMLKAEPKLCAAIGGDAKRLAGLLTKRATKLTDDRTAVREGKRIVGFRTGFGNIAAVVLAAERHDVAPLLNEKVVFDLVQSAFIMHTVPSLERQYLEWKSRDQQSRPRNEHHEAIAEPLGHSRREIRSGYAFTYDRRTIQPCRRRTSHCCCDCFANPNQPCRPATGCSNTPFSPWASWAEGYTAPCWQIPEQAVVLDYRFQPPCRRGIDPQLVHLTQPQLRDLALGVIVELSGQRPEKYGFIGAPFRHRRQPAAGLPLPDARGADQAFALAIKNYRQLGLEKPPKYTPEMPPRFLFVMGTNRGDLRPSLTSPDGKWRLELHGNKARVVDVATGKPIGKELDAGTCGGPGADFTFTCGSFSPDGKYVVTGSRFVEKFPKEADTVNTNVGKVEVWDAATGAGWRSRPAGDRQRPGGDFQQRWQDCLL